MHSVYEKGVGTTYVSHGTYRRYLRYAYNYTLFRFLQFSSFPPFSDRFVIYRPDRKNFPASYLFPVEMLQNAGRGARSFQVVEFCWMRPKLSILYSTRHATISTVEIFYRPFACLFIFERVLVLVEVTIRILC